MPSVNPSSLPSRRIAVQMWMFGLGAVYAQPAYMFTPQWMMTPNPWWVLHVLWLVPFGLGSASLVCARRLFRSPRAADKLGAVGGALVVGFWPPLFAVWWWTFYFASWLM